MRERGPEPVERCAELGRVEVAGGECPALVDQGVLGARVQLAAEHRVEGLERVLGDAVDLREHPERVGILDETVGRVRVERRTRQQLPHPLRHHRLASRPARLLDAWVEHYGVGVERLEREGRDSEPARQQPARVDREQRGVTRRHRVRAHEAERVAEVEANRILGWTRGRELTVKPHLALAQQGERDIGQSRQVARSERAELAGQRGDARVEGVDEPIEQPRRGPGAAEAQLVGARNHAGADQLGRERAAGADRVAAQQVPLETLAIGGVDRAVTQRADARGGAVQSLSALQQRRDCLARGLVPRACGGRECDPRGAPGHRVNRGGGQRHAIEHD